MRREVFPVLSVVGMMFLAMPVSATTLTIGSGWQADVISAPGAPTSKSAWTFTVATHAILSIVDGYIPDDVYTLSGDFLGTTSFYEGSASAVQATGSYGYAWTDSSYSKIALWVAPGTYSFSITGNGAGGTPSGLGVRLDVAAVPEPASWVMMVAAFGIVGATLRRRRAIVSFG
jgi:hypothetical protein